MRRLQRVAIIFLLCLTLVFPLSILAGALTLSDSENHEDSKDYCMRAYDVTMTLQEYQGFATSQELHAAILKDSHMELYLQHPREPYGGSYEVDYSALKGEESEEGYPITVILPTITEGVTSQFSFYVYISDNSESSQPAIYHHVTINYLDQETGTQIKGSYESNKLSNGRSYDVTAEANTVVSGYELSKIEGTLKGYITSDQTINVYYQKIEKPVVPEPPTPVEPEPEPPVEVPAPPVVEEPAVQAPVASKPSTTKQEQVQSTPAPQAEVPVEAPVTIPEPEVPVEEIPEEVPEKTQPPSQPEPQEKPVVVEKPVEKKGVSVTPLEATVVSVGAASVAILGAGIVSDLKVISWYEKMKRRKLGGIK